MSEEIVATAAATTDLALDQIPVITSLDMADEGNQAKAYNACIAADHKFQESKGAVIDLADYYIEPIAVTDDVTGETEVRKHIVIFDADGTTYEGQSEGIFSSLNRLERTFKISERTEPLPVKITEVKAKVGFMLVLTLA